MFFADGGASGRNFDFDDEPGAAAAPPPAGRLPVVSLVDISYLGFDRRNLHRSTPDDLAGAARLPFDGMNERGVAVAMAAVPEAQLAGRGRDRARSA